MKHHDNRSTPTKDKKRGLVQIVGNAKKNFLSAVLPSRRLPGTTIILCMLLLLLVYYYTRYLYMNIYTGCITRVYVHGIRAQNGSYGQHRPVDPGI